jgi:hypothetical protein
MAVRNFPRRTFSLPVEPILFNWRRGLFRIWLIASTGWMMGWTIYLLMYSLRSGYTGNRDFVAIPILARAAGGTFDYWFGDRLGIPRLRT